MPHLRTLTLITMLALVPQLSGCAFLTGAAVGGAAVYVLH